MCPAKFSSESNRGWIIPIGGGEKKVQSSAILNRFVELCGGLNAKIAIVPTASQLEDSGARYAAVFGDLGAGRSDVVAIAERSECEDPEILAILQQATGIFFTGGNQLRLSTIIGGSSVARLVRSTNAAGTHVAGTSAGAAFLCEHMIAHGQSGPTPRRGKATLSPGLGLTNRVIVDQHFRERDRLGRLLTALAYNPFATGIGVDEDTAAFIDSDNMIEVCGSGGLTIVDPSDLQFSSMAVAKSGKPISMVGVKLHILLAGDHYSLESHTATTGSASP